MSSLWLVAAVLLTLLAVVHSALGERFVLARLFRREDLPRLFGSEDMFKRTLRLAWHITSVTFWGIAALLVGLAAEQSASIRAARILSLTFAANAVVALVFSRGRHFAWIVFAAVAVALAG